MFLNGEGIDAPFGELIKICTDLNAASADVFDVADAVRAWRI
ncbi:hypothetical protein ACIBLA_28525 [Streptomyces sp. NPDC050433]